jgi:hypothetical protein
MKNTRREIMSNDTDQDILDIRHDGRLSIRDITQQPAWIRWPLYVLALCIIVVGIYIVGKILPFEPLQVSDVRVEPDSACGGEEVHVIYIGNMESGLYTLDDLDGFAYWQSSNDPRPYSSIYFKEESLDPFPEREFEGPTRRVAPWPYDQWHAGVDATLYGKRFGFVPVEQRIHLESDDYLQSKDRHSSECAEITND